jgi:hypothetical protein
MIGLDRDRLIDLNDRQGGAASQQLGQVADLRRIQMRSNNEAKPAVGWHRPEQLLQRLEAARSPLSGGIAPSSFCSASRPPADDPMPTIGNSPTQHLSPPGAAVKAPFPGVSPQPAPTSF